MIRVTEDIEVTKARIVDLKTKWLTNNVPDEADGQVTRAAHRFALTAAAGELAAEFGVVPWPSGEAAAGIAICFKAWLERHGGSGSLETQNALEQVRDFIVRHGTSRFATLANGKVVKDVSNRAGWRRKAEKRWDHLCAPSVFQNEICKGIDPRAAAKSLVEAELLVPGKDHPSKNVKIDEQTCRVYWITSAILDDPK